MYSADDKQHIRKLKREAAYKEFLLEVKEFLPKKNIHCFISYAWDDNSTPAGYAKNKIWHERLSKIKNDFKLIGVEVFLDIYNMDNRMNVTMASNIEKSEVIFLIGTKRLPVRLMDDQSPAAFEYKHIQDKLTSSPDCILAPLLFEGDYGDAFPDGMSSTIMIRDMKSDDAHEHIMPTLSNPKGLIACVFRLNDPNVDPEIKSRYEISHKKLYQAYALIDKEHPPAPIIPEKFVPLSNVLKDRVMSNELRYLIAIEIASQLTYIHQHPYEMQQNFSDQTIMLDINHHFKPKITGFKLSKTNAQKDNLKKQNIHSLGLVFWQLMSGKIFDKTVDKNAAGFLSQVPAIYANLIRLCLSDDVNQRPKAQDVVDYLKRNEVVCTDNALLSTFESPAQKSKAVFDSATKAKDTGDLVKAFNLYLLAAELGNSTGDANVGLMLLQGLGNIPIDKPRAFKHLFDAATQGEPRAQNNLARMYEKGDGIPENRAEAISWYTQAAQQDTDLKAKEVAKQKLQHFGFKK